MAQSSHVLQSKMADVKNTATICRGPEPPTKKFWYDNLFEEAEELHSSLSKNGLAWKWPVCITPSLSISSLYTHTLDKNWIIWVIRWELNPSKLEPNWNSAPKESPRCTLRGLWINNDNKDHDQKLVQIISNITNQQVQDMLRTNSTK